MCCDRAFSQWALALALAVPISLVMSIVVQVPTTQNAVAQTLDRWKAEGDRLFDQGNKLVEQNQNEGAIASFQKALAIYRELKERQKEGQTLKAIGNAYQNLKDYRRSIEFQQQALQIARVLKDSGLEVKILNSLAYAYNSTDQFQEALEVAQKAITKAQQTKNESGEAQALNRLGWAYLGLSKYPEAIDSSQKALPLFRKSNDRAGEAWEYNNLGFAYSQLSKYDEAIAWYKRALPILQEVKNHEGFHKVATNLGKLYYSKKDYKKAIEIHQKALEAARIIKNNELEADSLLLIALNHYGAESLTETLEFSEAALKIYRQRSDQPSQIQALTLISQSQGNLGIKTQEDGNYKLAEKYFRMSINSMQENLRLIEVVNQPKFNSRRVNLYGQIGNAYNLLGEDENALIFLKKSSSIAKQENSLAAWVDSRTSELNIYIGKQNSITIEEALKILDEVNEILGVAERHSAAPNIKITNGTKLYAYIKLSTAYFDAGDLKNAEEIARQAIKFSEDNQINNGASIAFGVLNRVYASQGKHESIISVVQKLLDAARRSKDPVMEINYLSQIASFYAQTADFKKSIQFSEEALRKCKEIDLEKVNPKLRSNVKKSQLWILLQLSSTYLNLGANEKARQFSAEASKFANNSSIPSLQFDALLNEASILVDQQSEITSGIDDLSLKQAISIVQNALLLIPLIKEEEVQGNPHREVIALAKLSQLFALQANYPKALESAQKAGKIAQDRKDLPSIRLALETLIYISNQQGDFAKLAILVKEYTDTIEKSPGSYQRSLLFSQIAYQVNSWGDYSTAEMLFKKALAEAKKGEVKFWIASVEQSLALVAWGKGESKQALELIEKNSDIIQSESIIARLQYYETASIVYGELGNNGKAIEFTKIAIGLTQKLQNRQLEKQELTLLGNLYRKFGRDSEALTAYESALAIRLSSDPKIEGQNNTAIYAGLAKIYANRKQTGIAVAFYKKSINSIENTRKLMITADPKLQQFFLQATIDFSKVKRADIYRQLADLLIYQGRIAEAQQILELLKIQEINNLDPAQRTNPKRLAELALNPIEQDIQTKHDNLIAFGVKVRNCEQNCQPLEAQLEQLRNAFKTYLDTIETALIKAKLKGDLVRIDERNKDFIASASKIVNAQPNTVLIYPLVLPDKIHLLWSSPGGILSSTTCPIGEAKLNTIVTNFQRSLRDATDLAGVQQHGKTLYDCLIKPLEEKGDWENTKIQNLVIAADRTINYIPIGALYDGKQFLAERYTISNILNAGLTDVSTRLPANPTVLGFGISDALDGFSSLPSVRPELETIKGLYPGSFNLNQDSTFARFKTLLAKQPFNIVHIATHGEFNPTHPNDSFLLLSSGQPGIGDRFTINRIEQQDDLRNVHLVVLSACQTASGQSSTSGIEIQGLSAAFVRDRAKAVIASLWNVNDTSTALLMQQFYKNLSQGMSKAKALRQTQLQFLQGKLTAKDAPPRTTVVAVPISGNRSAPSKTPTTYAHPYYWAPFILVGNSL